MSSTKILVSSSLIPISFDQSLPAYIPIDNFIPNPASNSTVMWRNIAKQTILRTPKKSSSSSYSSSLSVIRPCSFLEFSQEPVSKLRPFELNSCKNLKFRELGFHRNGEFTWKDKSLGSPVLGIQVSFSWSCPKGYASLAEIEVVSSTDVEEEVPIVDEFGELLEEMRKEHRRVSGRERRLMRMRNAGGLECNKYQALRRRQVRIETEAWKQAAKEYQELLADMCEQKLAPNLPYMKSLFLGWFEPLRDKIAAEQVLIRQKKCRAAYAPYFDLLPADMMAVVTMHKLMGMLMTGGEHGSARIVHAACALGEAIEHEVGIYKFLEKTKKKKADQYSQEGEGDPNAGSVDQSWLRKKVTDLMKKQQLQAVRHIIKTQDDSKFWDTCARAKVGSRLIDFLIQTAYIQPPADQAAEGPPDIRPAFIHTFQNVVMGRKKTNKRYGVIECDPLVRKGLEKTARHMVIPYMPMLVPPVQWTGG